MAFQLQAGQRAKVAHFKGDKTNMKHFEKYTTANLSTSKPKGRGQDGFTYSNWSYVRFVGKAHEFMRDHVKDGDLIVIESGIVTKENYEKDGKTVYPTSEQVVVFDVGLYRKGSSKTQESDADGAELAEEDSDSIPF